MLSPAVSVVPASAVTSTEHSRVWCLLYAFFHQYWFISEFKEEWLKSKKVDVLGLEIKI